MSNQLLGDIEELMRSCTSVDVPRLHPKKVRFRCDFNSTILDVLRDRGWIQVEPDDDSWHLFWCEVTQVRATLDGRRMEGEQKIPHFRNHCELTRKNMLARNLKRLKRLYQKQHMVEEAALCDCMPLTFELPSEYLMFVETYRCQPGATWIVKPASGCQGRGIFLFQKLRDLVEWRNRKDLPDRETPPALDGDHLPEVYVVQKYVEKPYLLAGRKFDLRIFVLVTSFYPLKAWLAREGFARLTGEQFSLTEINDNRVHLTNTTIQLKGSPHREKGCKWSIRRLREFLTARHGAQAVDGLMQRVARVVVTSLQSVQAVITQNRHCFELYGYDVLLDEDLSPWLLEVNASPSLIATDKNDYILKHALLMDALNVLDFEGRLIGTEKRVGGFDLLWDNGPVYAPCTGTADCGHDGPPPFVDDPTRLNVFLGCLNDREEQLKEVWINAEVRSVPYSQLSPENCTNT